MENKLGIKPNLNHFAVKVIWNALLDAREELEKRNALLRECDSLLWQHHEIGAIRRLNDSGTCAICRDSGIFARLNQAAPVLPQPPEKEG